MHIHLLRHGIAEDARPDLDDHDRALTEDGRRRLGRAAAAWQRLVPTPDVVFCSPLRRARETAAVFVEAVGFRGELRIDQALIPSASPNTLIAMLEAENLSGTASVAAIGHEPHLGYLFGVLATTNPRLSIPLKKGMLVALGTMSTTSVVSELRFVLSQKAAAQLG